MDGLGLDGKRLYAAKNIFIELMDLCLAINEFNKSSKYDPSVRPIHL